MSSGFTLHKNTFNQIVLTVDGTVYEGVVPVKNFPINAAREHLSFVDPEGKERLFIRRLDDLPPNMKTIVEEELRTREFMPTIEQIQAVSTYTTPSKWKISTDRGPTELVLKGEEDIRRISNSALIITDAQGTQYQITNLYAMDRRSLRFLERFL